MGRPRSSTSLSINEDFTETSSAVSRYFNSHRLATPGGTTSTSPCTVVPHGCGPPGNRQSPRQAPRGSQPTDRSAPALPSLPVGHSPSEPSATAFAALSIVFRQSHSGNFITVHELVPDHCYTFRASPALVDCVHHATTPAIYHRAARSYRTHAARLRSPLLQIDLNFLGQDLLETIPSCTVMPLLLTYVQAPGSMYVIEGCTLGGTTWSKPTPLAATRRKQSIPPSPRFKLSTIGSSSRTI